MSGFLGKVLGVADPPLGLHDLDDAPCMRAFRWSPWSWPELQPRGTAPSALVPPGESSEVEELSGSDQTVELRVSVGGDCLAPAGPSHRVPGAYLA